MTLVNLFSWILGGVLSALGIHVFRGDPKDRGLWLAGLLLLEFGLFFLALAWPTPTVQLLVFVLVLTLAGFLLALAISWVARKRRRP